MSSLILFFIIILILVCFYFDHNRLKRVSNKELNILYNQITKEQRIQEHYQQELINVLALEKEVNQKLLTLRVDIVTIDFHISEIII